MSALDHLIAKDITEEADLKSNLSTYKKSLKEFVPEKVLRDYTQRFRANLITDQIWLNLKPADLVIAGKQLGQLRKSQPKVVVDRFKKKFKDLNGSATRLGDVLAELEVATCIGFYFSPIELDKNTGVSGMNSEVYVPKVDVHVEIKHFEMGRSDYEIEVNADISELEKQNSRGVYFAGDEKLEKQSDSESVLAVSTKYNPQKQILGMLYDAHQKFPVHTHAVIFLQGLPGYMLKSANQAIEQWQSKVGAATGVKNVIVVERRSKITGLKQTQRVVHIEDAIVADFLKTIELV